MSRDEGLADSAISRMVGAVRDEWRVRGVDEFDRGGNEVYRVSVDTPGGPRECVLKADGGGGDLLVEAGVLDLLAGETTVPVPRVFGVVDDRPDLRTPFFLMEHLDGQHPPVDADAIPTDDFVAIARETGRYLGEVHSLDAFDAFGTIQSDDAVPPDADGGALAPARDHGLAIPGAYDSWDAYLANSADSLLARHRETRFSDLTPRLRDTIERRCERLDLDGDPAIARIDHGASNLLVDPGSNAITGVPDWGLVRSMDGEYELVCAEQGFCGTTPLDADRRLRFRSALYDGYRETHHVDPDEEVDARWRLYALVFEVARMTWVSDWITTGSANAVEEGHREFVAELL